VEVTTTPGVNPATTPGVKPIENGVSSAGPGFEKVLPPLRVCAEWVGTTLPGERPRCTELEVGVGTGASSLRSDLRVEVVSVLSDFKESKKLSSSLVGVTLWT
jgi:hypothetical protein